MATSCFRPALGLLLALLVSGCASDNDEQQKQLAQMRTDIEQLTNALGRLEFRVYELENQQPADTAEAVTEKPGALPAQENTNQQNDRPPAVNRAAPEQTNKRYDLAPVE